MSEIHVRRIRNFLQREFDGLIDLSDVQNRPEKELEQFFLTRSQAALALQHVADLEKDEAAQAIVDGFDDNGIDAIYFDEVVGECYIVQSKWNSSGNKSPDLGSVEKFLSGFRDLLTEQYNRFNSKLLKRKDVVERVLNSHEVTFVLVIAYTGTQALSEPAERRINDLLNELNNPSEVVAYRVYSQGELYNAIAGLSESASIRIEVTLHEWGQIREPYQAFYGQVSAEEIARWYAEHSSRLFARNLRKFRGDTEVNRAIKATLVRSPGKFWYFNNGITVLCNSIGKKAIGGATRDTGHFVCEGVSVVNGAQTVGNIANAVAQGFPKARDAKVLVRFISLEDCPPNFATEVTTATNTQNKIEQRDFASLDPEQERLRTELMLDLKKVYIYKSGDPVPAYQDGCTIDEATVALACAHPDIRLAAAAKRNIGSLWKNINEPPYTLLFNSRLSAHRLWHSVSIARTVEAEIDTQKKNRNGIERRIAVHGNRFILHWIFREVQLASFDKMQYDVDKAAGSAQARVPTLIDEIAHAIRTQFKDAYLNSFFKSASQCEELAKSLGIPYVSVSGVPYYAPTDNQVQQIPLDLA